MDIQLLRLLKLHFIVKEYVQDNPGDFDLVEFVLFDDSTYNVYLKETGSNLIEL